MQRSASPFVVSNAVRDTLAEYRYPPSARAGSLPSLYALLCSGLGVGAERISTNSGRPDRATHAGGHEKSRCAATWFFGFGRYAEVSSLNVAAPGGEVNQAPACLTMASRRRAGASGTGRPAAGGRVLAPMTRGRKALPAAGSPAVARRSPTGVPRRRLG